MTSHIARVRKVIWVVGGVLAVAMGWKTARASFEDFGQRRGPLSGPQSLWHRVEGVNRLLWAAGKRPDLCGLAIINLRPVWTGGYAYLHRDVPVLYAPIEALADSELGGVRASANYVLTGAAFPLPAEYETVETIGDTKLARRRGACAAPPDSYTRLFPE